MKKNRILIAILTTIFLTVSGYGQNKLLVSLNFNDDSQIELKNGGTIGSGKTGVSGKVEDKAYFAEVKNFEDPTNGAAALLKNTPQVVGLEELTASFWYKPAEKQVNAVTLFNAGSLTLITDGKGGWVYRVGAEAEKGVNYWFNSGNKGSYVEWFKPNDWIFAVFTWNKEKNEVCFYQGTEKNSLKLQKCHKRTETVKGLIQRTDKRLDAIGNTLDTKYARPFNGSIDNFRLYSKTLNLNDGEKIRQADLKNQEPAL